jgi:hypothetical protein
MGLFVLRPVPGDRIDVRLIVCLSLACRRGRGLAMGLGYELGGADVRHPDLDRPKALTAQPLSVLSYTFTGGSHTTIVSCNERPVDVREPPLTRRCNLSMADTCRSMARGLNTNQERRRGQVRRVRRAGVDRSRIVALKFDHGS